MLFFVYTCIYIHVHVDVDVRVLLTLEGFAGDRRDASSLDHAPFIPWPPTAPRGASLGWGTGDTSTPLMVEISLVAVSAGGLSAESASSGWFFKQLSSTLIADSEPTHHTHVHELTEQTEYETVDSLSRQSMRQWTH